MTQIKIKKTRVFPSGEQFFPITHTKAVIDDNGYSVESRMQAVQDEVNQAQMAIGAVPSDLAPTEGSSNWVTSGGVYNATTVGNANVEIDLSGYTAVRAYPNPNTWLVTNSSFPYYGMFIPVEANRKYRITANASYDSTYAFLTTNTYRQGATVSYATGCEKETVPAGASVIVESASNASYLWIGTYTTHDVTPQKIEEYNKIAVRELLNEIDTVPTKDSKNLVSSDGVYQSMRYYTYVVTPSYSTLSGSYVKTDGSLGESSSFSITSLIPVKAGQIVECTASFQAAIALISLVNDSSYTPVAVPQSSDTTLKRETVRYTAESDGYVICSGRTASGETIDIVIYGQDETVNLENLLDRENIPYYELCDVNSLTKYDYAIVSSGKWGTTQTAKHVYLPLSGVNKVKLSCVGGVNGAFYAFVTSMSYSLGGNVPYATGENRRWAGENTEYDMTIPNGASYLCLVTKDANSNNVSWTVWTSSSNMSAKDMLAGLSHDVSSINSSTKITNFRNNSLANFYWDSDHNTAYSVIRVFKNTLDGESLIPRITYVGPSAYSAKELAIYKDYDLVINCGLGRLTGGSVEGILIQDGVVVNNSQPLDHGSVFPLTIDQNGDLGYAAPDADAEDLIANGIEQAFCGFAPLIVNYEDFNDQSAYQDMTKYNQGAQRQIIGQFNNGDYCIITCEGRGYDNSVGWTIPECKAMCKSLNLKFAYNCDGGASTQTVVGKKQLQTWYERRICTYLYF